MRTNLVTREGYDKLRNELNYLWREYRPEITAKVTWAASLGAPGLFAQTGLFSQYVIGSAELLAATLLLLGLFPALRRLQTIGALIAVAVMTGAVNFHLWTPLGIDPNNDGGGLFVMAVTVWLSSIAMLIARREPLFAILSGIRDVLVPPMDMSARSETRHVPA